VLIPLRDFAVGWNVFNSICTILLARMLFTFGEKLSCGVCTISLEFLPVH
jgi:hypothetical protein